jgi:hypothetical protein
MLLIFCSPVSKNTRINEKRLFARPRHKMPPIILSKKEKRCTFFVDVKWMLI